MRENFWEVLAPTWVFILGLLGAVVAFFEGLLSDMRKNVKTDWQFKFLTFFAHVSSSALAAILAHRWLHALHVSDDWQIPLVGIAAHMGTEALKFGGELWRQQVRTRLLGTKMKDEEGKE